MILSVLGRLGFSFLDLLSSTGVFLVWFLLRPLAFWRWTARTSRFYVLSKLLFKGCLRHYVALLQAWDLGEWALVEKRARRLSSILEEDGLLLKAKQGRFLLGEIAAFQVRALLQMGELRRALSLALKASKALSFKAKASSII